MELAKENFLETKNISTVLEKNRTTSFKRWILLLLAIFLEFSTINIVLIYNFFYILRQI